MSGIATRGKNFGAHLSRARALHCSICLLGLKNYCKKISIIRQLELKKQVKIN
jgi:hypothetical protein